MVRHGGGDAAAPQVDRVGLRARKQSTVPIPSLPALRAVLPRAFTGALLGTPGCRVVLPLEATFKMIHFHSSTFVDN